MFINHEGMLTAIDRMIKFGSLVPINTKEHEKYFCALDIIFQKYNSARFIIKTIHCDGKYCAMMETVSDDLNAEMNYANAQDHVPETKQNNHTINE